MGRGGYTLVNGDTGSELSLITVKRQMSDGVQGDGVQLHGIEICVLVLHHF